MNVKTEAAKLLTVIRDKEPLIHNITNYVTVNDCANAILAVGASPIMADDINEAADITAISSALVINIGTLNQRTIASMLKAGKKANELGIPVIFDPVGAGASRLRNDTTKEIISQIKISILRGNLSEVSFVAGLEVSTKGVDSSREDDKKDSTAIAKAVAKQLNCIAAITGAVDVISDGNKTIRIMNGHSMLSKVTGTGCMTSAIVGSFAGATNNYLAAAVCGVASMGIAGEIAYKKAGMLGIGSFHIAIIDSLNHLNEELMKEMAKIEEQD
jgi:hydroxyethylthiazole kinase